MAKIQKTIMVPDSLYELCKEFEKRNGTSFTRIVTAGLLSYLLHGLDDDKGDCPLFGPSSVWMPLAVQLDAGDMTMDDLPGKFLEAIASDCERLIEQVRKSDASPEKKRELVTRFKRSAKIYRKRLEHWNGCVDVHGCGTKAIVEDYF